MKVTFDIFSAALAPVRARFSALVPREQFMVRVAASLIGLTLLWSVAVAPAWRTLSKAESQHLLLEAELQKMQNLQAQAKALQAQPSLSREEVARALEASVKQTLGSSAQLNVTGERAVLTLRGTPADVLALWLTQARVNARALPSEARLTRTALAAATATTTVLSPTASAAPTSTAAPVAGAAAWSGTLVLSLPAQ